jgi:uncharacterized membrane protein
MGGPEARPKIRGMKFLAALAIASSVFSIIQQTPLAPFPHNADGFVLGLAAGFVIVIGLAFFTRSK